MSCDLTTKHYGVEIESFKPTIHSHVYKCLIHVAVWSTVTEAMTPWG